MDSSYFALELNESYYIRTRQQEHGRGSFYLKKYEEQLFNVSQLRYKQDELQSAYKVIEEKNKDIIDSLMYAKRIQEAMLPEKSIMNDYLERYFVFSKPRDIVSGDFYWVGRKGGKAIIAVADSTGHGVPGAFMSLIGTMILNKIINDQNFSMPSYILYLFHQELRNILKQHSYNKNAIEDGMDISICAIDFSKNELQFSGANRPVYICSKNKVIKLRGEPYGIGGYRLGLHRTFTNHKIKFSKGTDLYMLTDGFADQFGGDRGKKFTSKRLSQLLSETSNLPIFEKKDFIEKTFNEWRGPYTQTDDIMVVGIRL